MIADEYVEQREQLLDSIEKGESALREAMLDLANVAHQQLAPSEHIRSSPFPWLAGAFLVGAWMGARRRD